jgi:sugar transferase (PEP-CTERM/EpsH1 system associated)
MGSLSRPTVCQVLHSLQVGGAEMLATRYAHRLRDHYRLIFACLDSLGSLGEQLQADGFPVFVLQRTPGLDLKCAWRLAELLRRERVDLIHAHQYTPFFYSLIARLRARRPPILFQEHGRHHPDTRRVKRVLANRILLERRDRVVGVGESVRQALIEKEGIPAGRVSVIYNGIDLPPRGFVQSERAVARQELGVGPAEPLIIQVARLDYLKDHATAIRSIAHVVNRWPNARLFLVGDGPLREAIEEAVGRANLERAVRLLGQRSDVARLLTAADLFLLTSISEGIPLTVIEAMAAGLPVVSTAVGGVAEVVEDGVTGFLTPAGDDHALATRIGELLDSPRTRQEMGRRGRDRAETLFSEQGMCTRYHELYREMLGD